MASETSDRPKLTAKGGRAPGAHLRDGTGLLRGHGRADQDDRRDGLRRRVGGTVTSGSPTVISGLAGHGEEGRWTARKNVRETVVLSAMKAILAELAHAFGDGKILRPDRDARFSAGRSPCKAHIGAVIGAGYRDGRLAGRSRRRPSRRRPSR